MWKSGECTHAPGAGAVRAGALTHGLLSPAPASTGPGLKPM